MRIEIGGRRHGGLARNGLLLVAMLGIGALVIFGAGDLRRYLKMRSM